MRTLFFWISLAVFAAVGVLGWYWTPALWSFVVLVPLFALGCRDAFQTRRAVLRNFPVIGNFRYLFEMIRPEINQYFIESNTDGTPFDREQRSLVYQRAKRQLDTLPFGTQHDVYKPGYEWINHSLCARRPPEKEPRVRIGEGRCAKPYSSSLLNISAMSYGALSSNAILALNGGAMLGGFAHNTGEGGISPFHKEPGGDLIWQIGTGYFGCRDAEGRFDPERFAQTAAHESVKMIEIKLSQGAKPGHGGILPGAKVTPQIAEIRGVPVGKDVLSPPTHTTFSTPRGLLEWIGQLRELSGGKPVGIKLCIGNPQEFLSLCKAMCATGERPDFIAIDGGEGGTGAAPLEFSNSMGTPLREGLVFVHSALTGFGLRDDLKVIAAGKVVTGFDMAACLALGADLCYSARSMMLAIGCIQARRCNSNHCPVGVATQNPKLVVGLDVGDKVRRTANYHRETIHSFLELLGAAGFEDPSDLKPEHLYRRTGPNTVKRYDELYEFLEPGVLLEPPIPERWRRWWEQSDADHFSPRAEPVKDPVPELTT